MDRNGRHRQNRLQQRGLNSSPIGVCICPQCNYSIPHQRGVPCTTILCPKCHTPLIRQSEWDNSNHTNNTKPQVQVLIKNPESPGYPIVDTELCIGCGACEKKCRFDAIHVVDGKAKISTETCRECRVCVNTCPVGALS